MKNKINIAELLRDCPKGMELDCTMYDNLYFDSLSSYYNETINCYTLIDGIKTSICFTKDGTFNTHTNAKCVIFPKGKTTWDDFVPPCKFKDGDIVHVDCGGTYKYYAIFKQIKINDNVCVYGIYDIQDDSFHKHENLCDASNAEIRLATEEEKAKLFKSIKDNGYKWNSETKTLEKLQQFKVGDRIRKKGEYSAYTISHINYGHYFCGNCVICDIYDNDWELVPDKFDITTLVPFESRVLVRDYDNRIWIPTFWGKRLEDDSNCSYLTAIGCYKYCIPYEGNEHLLGTINDCDDFYKTWE